MNDCIMRGDIFCANLNNGIGAEQRGYRPVLIIQNNTGNKFSPTVIVAVITGQIHHKARMPTHCQLSSHSALSIDANYIKRKAEQISNELNPKVLKVKINGRKS